MFTTSAPKQRSTQRYSSLTSCCSIITDGGFIAVRRQAGAHRAGRIRHRRSQQLHVNRAGSKPQLERKLDFIKPTLRMLLTALFPTCPERVHTSHKCLDFCNFTACSCTVRGRGVPPPDLDFGYAFFLFVNKRFFFLNPSYI